MFATAHRRCCMLRLLLLHSHRRPDTPARQTEHKGSYYLTHYTGLSTDLLGDRGRKQLKVILLVPGDAPRQEDGIGPGVGFQEPDYILFLLEGEGVGGHPLQVPM